ncbi:MAG: DnaJ domain-containing protein [Geminicoccaceae bacterium]
MVFAYLALGILVLAGLMLVARWYVTVPPTQLAQAARTFVATFTGLAGTGLIFAGRYALAAIAGIAFIAALRALKTGRGHAGAAQDHADAQEVETKTLRMRLVPNTGELDGEILSGDHVGSWLSQLGISEVIDLLQRCLQEDPPSVALLETYLDRRAPDWRGDAAGAEAGANGSQQAGAGPMSEATALEILGLEQGASAQEIKDAHRHLMSLIHPDKGGSGYLAAQINAAKEFLLAQKTR